MDEQVKKMAEQVGIVPINDAKSIGFKENMSSFYCKGYMLEELVKLIRAECVTNCNMETDISVNSNLK